MEQGTRSSPLSYKLNFTSDTTHFVYELIQNADDSKSQHLELQLSDE